jgi:hypothetical protein
MSAAHVAGLVYTPSIFTRKAKPGRKAPGQTRGSCHWRNGKITAVKAHNAEDVVRGYFFREGTQGLSIGPVRSRWRPCQRARPAGPSIGGFARAYGRFRSLSATRNVCVRPIPHRWARVDVTRELQLSSAADLGGATSRRLVGKTSQSPKHNDACAALPTPRVSCGTGTAAIKSELSRPNRPRQ